VRMDTCGKHSGRRRYSRRGAVVVFQHSAGNAGLVHDDQMDIDLT
jgi:hypothetical protein